MGLEKQIGIRQLSLQAAAQNCLNIQGIHWLSAQYSPGYPDSQYFRTGLIQQLRNGILYLFFCLSFPVSFHHGGTFNHGGKMSFVAVKQ